MMAKRQQADRHPMRRSVRALVRARWQCPQWTPAPPRPVLTQQHSVADGSCWEASDRCLHCASTGTERGHVSSGIEALLRAEVNRLEATQRDSKHGAVLLQPSARASNRAMEELFERQRMTDALGLMDEMHRAGQRVAKQNYNTLLYVWSKRKHNLARVMSLLKEMVHNGSANVRSFNTALVACSRANSIEDAMDTLAAMRAADLPPGAFAYANVINCCARTRDVDLAESLWSEMLADGVEPSVEALNCLLKVYNAAGEGYSSAAMARVKACGTQFGVHMDSRTGATLLACLLRDNRIEDAISTIERMLKSGIAVEMQVCNLVLERCCALQQWQVGVKLGQLLQRHGMLVDPNTRQLLNTCRQQPAHMSRAPLHAPSKRPVPTKQLKRKLYALISRLKKWADASDADWPELKRVSSWKALFDLDAADDLETLFELLVSQNLVFDDVCDWYLQSFARAGRVEAAVKVLERVVVPENRSLSDATYNKILLSCGRQGKVDLARQVLQVMIDHHSATTVSFNAVLNALAEQGDVDAAMLVYTDMQDQSIEPDIVTINTLLKCFAKATAWNPSRHGSLAEAALGFYGDATAKHSLMPDCVTHFSLFRALRHAADVSAQDHASEDDHDDEYHIPDNTAAALSAIVDICIDADIETLDVGVFNAAIDFCQHVGDVATAFEVYNIMCERDIKATDATITLLLCACGRADQADMGLTFLHHLMDSSVNDARVSVNVMNGAIRMSALAGRPVEANKLLTSMRESGVLAADDKSFEHVLNGYARIGNADEAWSLLHEMQAERGRATTAAYNHVLEACAKATNARQGLDYFRSMQTHADFKPDIHTFNALLQCLHCEDDNDGDNTEVNPAADFAEELPNHHFWETWKEMQTKYRLQPNLHTFRVALATLDSHNDHSGIVRVFDELVQRVPALLPDAMCLVQHIDACAQLQDQERLQQLTADMKQWRSLGNQRFKLPTRVFIHLISAFEACGASSEVFTLLKEMHSAYGVAPSVSVFNRVMQLCNTLEQHHYVHQIFLTMQHTSEYHVFPNAESYVHAIQAAESMDDWVQATNLFVTMQKAFPAEDLTPALIQKIALGRYNAQRTTFPSMTDNE